MANFSPANWAEILLRLHDELQPGNVKIGALFLSQFGLLAALNFQLFGMVTA